MRWILWVRSWRVFWSDCHLNRDLTVVHENSIGLADSPVALSVDRQLARLNAHIGVAARHETVGRLAVYVGKTLGRGDRPAVTIRHANGVASHLRFYFSEKQVVRLAA